MKEISKQHSQLPNNMEMQAKDQLVYVVIKSFQNNKGICKPSLATISERSGISIPTIRDSINRLQDAEYLEVKKVGRCNTYIFNSYKNFEPFSPEFLDRKDITPTTKAYLVAIQQFMYKDVEGLGKISYSNRELARKSGVSEATIRKSNIELENKNYLTILKNQLKDGETGCKTETKIYHLAELGQAVIWALSNHEDRIKDLEKENAAKDKLIKAMLQQMHKDNKLLNVTID